MIIVLAFALYKLLCNSVNAISTIPEFDFTKHPNAAMWFKLYALVITQTNPEGQKHPISPVRRDLET